MVEAMSDTELGRGLYANRAVQCVSPSATIRVLLKWLFY